MLSETHLLPAFYDTTQNITIALVLKVTFVVATIVSITDLWPAFLADTGATALVAQFNDVLGRKPASSNAVDAKPT